MRLQPITYWVVIATVLLETELRLQGKAAKMRVHLINPSDVSFGIGVITPRWLYVLAGSTPPQYGDPIITDETLEQLDPESIGRSDVVGIGIHTANALRGFQIGKLCRARGAWVVFGG